jgi:hypothetical protein
MKKPYPKWSCGACGEIHGSGKKPKEKYFGQCDVCGKKSWVSEPAEFGEFRDWFNPKPRYKIRGRL